MKTEKRHGLMPAMLLFIVSLIPAVVRADVTVSNVVASQRAGTRLVDIHYDLSGNTPPFTVNIRISSDGGKTFTVPATTVSGAFGSGLTAGTGKLVTWNAGQDWSGNYSTSMCFEVTAVDTPPVAEGFLLIPAGNFAMGDQSNPLVGSPDELPERNVRISDFYMSKFLVTKALWDEVLTWGAVNGYGDLAPGAGKAADHPVQTVSWNDTVKWCNAYSEKTGRTPCYQVSGATYRTGSNDAVVCNWNANGYRLPSEAEWEKAARGGFVAQNFPWGNTISHAQADYISDPYYSYDVSPTRGFHPVWSADGQYPYTSSVGSFAANGYGLYDMAGNVFEWCWDWYGNYDAASLTDPHGPATGSNRVSRGGTWALYASECRVSSRLSSSPTSSNNTIGFRLVFSNTP